VNALLFIHFLLLLTGGVSPKEELSISVPTDPIRLAKPTFSLLRVEDSRQAGGPVGQLYRTAQQTVPARVLGGIEASLTTLLRPGFRPDSVRVPVVIQVRTFGFTEKLRSDGKIDGSFRLQFSFKTPQNDRLMPLTTYSTETRYIRTLNQTAPLGGVVRGAVLEAVEFLSDWITTNRANSISLVKGVQFVFRDYTTQHARSDTVFHDPKRPLRWSDFEAKPRGGRLGAAVYASFSYEGRSRWVNGYLQVVVTFRTFMQKSMSWVSPSVAAADDQYSLLHEQRHFDIVKLVVERFKQRILIDDDMDAEYYDSRLQYLYLDAYRDMNRRQEQYDAETQHGLNRAAQEVWNQRIIDELRRAEEQTAGLLKR